MKNLLRAFRLPCIHGVTRIRATGGCEEAAPWRANPPRAYPSNGVHEGLLSPCFGCTCGWNVLDGVLSLFSCSGHPNLARPLERIGSATIWELASGAPWTVAVSTMGPQGRTEVREDALMMLLQIGTFVFFFLWGRISNWWTLMNRKGVWFEGLLALARARGPLANQLHAHESLQHPPSFKAFVDPYTLHCMICSSYIRCLSHAWMLTQTSHVLYPSVPNISDLHVSKCTHGMLAQMLKSWFLKFLSRPLFLFQSCSLTGSCSMQYQVNESMPSTYIYASALERAIRH